MIYIQYRSPQAIDKKDNDNNKKKIVESKKGLPIDDNISQEIQESFSKAIGQIGKEISNLVENLQPQNLFSSPCPFLNIQEHIPCCYAKEKIVCL